ncbi:hypothetical protein RFI_20147, partial [Reticulomyxa filosa]
RIEENKKINEKMQKNVKNKKNDNEKKKKDSKKCKREKDRKKSEKRKKRKEKKIIEFGEMIFMPRNKQIRTRIIVNVHIHSIRPKYVSYHNGDKRR